MDRERAELLLVWKHPLTRQRYLIGRLSRHGGRYHFSYVTSGRRSLQEAERAGFRLLDMFPDPYGRRTSPTLFAVFSRRLPGPSGLDALARQGIDAGDPMEVLRVTGGRLPTDTLEFLEPIRTQQEAGRREYRVRFPVAGWRYYRGEQAMERGELAAGTLLRLELEPHNEWDPCAIRVVSPSGILLGYVPAVYAWYLDAAVESGQYEARVAAVGPADDPQQRLAVDFRGWASPLPEARSLPQGVEKYAAALSAR